MVITTSIRLAIVACIVIIVIYFINLGYNEQYTAYDDTYAFIDATIVDRAIDEQDFVEQVGDTLQHKKLYRMLLKYTYEIDDITYTGSFYNDGTTTAYIDHEQFSNIYNKTNTTTIPILYTPNNPKLSFSSYNNIREKYKKRYYTIAAALTLLVPLILYSIDTTI